MASKYKSIDDFLGSMRDKSFKDIDKAFKHFDSHTEDKIIDHMRENILGSAQDEMYNAIKSGVKEHFGGDDVPEDELLQKGIHNKKEELQKIISGALLKYFDKVSPGISKTINEHKLSDEEKYQQLTKAYDEHIGADQNREIAEKYGMTGIAESLAKTKKAKVKDLTGLVRQRRDESADVVATQLRSKAFSHYLGSFRDQEIGAYLKPKLKGKYEIDDPVGYLNMGKGKLLNLREHLEKKKKGINPEDYNLTAA